MYELGMSNTTHLRPRRRNVYRRFNYSSKYVWAEQFFICVDIFFVTFKAHMGIKEYNRATWNNT